VYPAGRVAQAGCWGLSASGDDWPPPVWFKDGGWCQTPIYQREKLPGDARFSGPAIVVQLDTTTVIEPGTRVEIDAIGNLILWV
jgi:N-methylhydantoinase A